MKVYVITAGVYSDYHICAVTTHPESAENLRLRYSDDRYTANIEIYETEIDLIRPDTCWFVSVNSMGKLTSMYELPSIYCKQINKVHEADGKYEVFVQTKDESHAKKIAFDLIATYKYEKFIEDLDEFKKKGAKE